MNINEFWNLISLIDQGELEETDDEAAVDPLITVLSSKSGQDIDQFHEHLSQALYAIDGAKWIEQAGESSDSPDAFLYARCYVVAKGKEFYSQVLNTPNLMPKSVDQWAESLIYVPGQAWAKVTGNDEEEYENRSTVSYETGSNESQW